MNHETNSLESGAPSAAPNTPRPAQPAREPYTTPRLSNFGRFQHLTAATSLQGTNPDEAVFDDGEII